MQEKVGRVFEPFTDLTNSKNANKLPMVQYIEREKWQIQRGTQACELAVANGLATML